MGGDCYSDGANEFKPVFDPSVHTQIYILGKNEPAWGVDQMQSGDPEVDDYWHVSWRWYRRHLVMSHERKHQADGKKNYDAWKSALESEERNVYPSQCECIHAVEQAIFRTWAEFNASEERDVNTLHTGGRP